VWQLTHPSPAGFPQLEGSSSTLAEWVTKDINKSDAPKPSLQALTRGWGALLMMLLLWAGLTTNGVLVPEPPDRTKNMVHQGSVAGASPRRLREIMNWTCLRWQSSVVVRELLMFFISIT